MIKILTMILVLFMFYSPVVVQANIFNDAAGNIGAAMGAAAAERDRLKGKITRKVWVDKKYNTDRMKRFLVAIALKGNNYDVQMDGNIFCSHLDVLKRAMNNEYSVNTVVDIQNFMQVNYPMLKYGTYEYQKKAFELMASSNAVVVIKIYKYQSYNGMTNVSYDITVSPSNNNQKIIFSYKESRFEVPYKSGVELFEEIVEKMMPKFNNYFRPKSE